MKEDIRYSEFLFLRHLSQLRSTFYFCPYDRQQYEAVGLSSVMYSEMALALLEDLYIRFENYEIQRIVGRLRGEISIKHNPSWNVKEHEWNDPREALKSRFSGPAVYEPRITYRGLLRMEELRDLLKRDRVLEDFGILLSLRYFRRDLEDAIRRASDISVSVLYLDMDNFGIINKKHGQEAGDVVMKAYLESVQIELGDFGTAYRGCGDEVAALIIGQGHEKTVGIAESIRQKVEALACDYKGHMLPKVSTSIGVATNPPAHRTMDLEILAESRKRQAKETGKNRVISS